MAYSFQVTAAGIGSAISAASAGISLNVTTYRLGSAFGYIPSTSDTDIHGTLLHTDKLTDVVRVSTTQLQYIVTLGADLGDYNFGEIGLYTDTGILFGLLVSDIPLPKQAGTGGEVGTVYDFRLPVNFDISNSILQISAETVQIGRLGEVLAFNQLIAASASPTNSYVIEQPLSSGNSLAFTTTDSQIWTFSNYTLLSDNLSLVGRDDNYVDIAATSLPSITQDADLIFQFESGVAVGLVRSITSYETLNNTNVRIHFEDSLPNTQTGDTIQILYNVYSEIQAAIAAAAANALAQMASIYIPLTQKAAINGVATLDANGLIPPEQLPPLAINDTFPVANQAAMLALTAQRGDIAIRSDILKTYILHTEPASVLGNWLEIITPALVQSVNNKTGIVTLTPDDIGGVPATRKVNSSGHLTGGGDLTADRNLSVGIASAQQMIAGNNNLIVMNAAVWSILPRVVGTNGYLTIPVGDGGNLMMVQWGLITFSGRGNVLTTNFRFGQKFLQPPWSIVGNADAGANSSWHVCNVTFAPNGDGSGGTCTIDSANPQQAIDAGRNVKYIAIGYWSSTSQTPGAF